MNILSKLWHMLKMEFEKSTGILFFTLLYRIDNVFNNFV